MQTKLCPDCGDDIPYLAKHHKCGWQEIATGKKKPPDPLHLICQHVRDGQRCAELGTLSESLRGEGPWYCHKHFPPFSGRSYGRKRAPPPAGFRPLKELLHKPDPEAIAEREALQDGL